MSSPPAEADSKVRVIRHQVLIDPGRLKDKARAGGKREPLDREDLIATYERHTLGHKDLAKRVHDVFSEGFDLVGEDARLVNAIWELLREKEVLDKLEDALRGAMLLGVSLLYKNYRDRASDPEQPIQGDPTDLVSLNVIYEQDIDELQPDLDLTSDRFRQLEKAVITVKDPNEVAPERKVKTVHHSRLIHLPWDPLFGKLRGMSFYSPSHDAYKALMNIEFAMGETFWGNANGPMVVDPGPEAGPQDLDQLEEVLKEPTFTGAIIVPHQTSIRILKPEHIPPAQYTDFFTETVSDMPSTILTGAHEGAVTGSETNLQTYHADIKGIQEQVVSPVIMGLLDELQGFGLLPGGEMPEIVWRPLWDLSEKEEAEVLHRRAMAAGILRGDDLRGLPAIMTIPEIRERIFGLEPEVPEELQDVRRDRLEIPTEVRARVLGLVGALLDRHVISLTRGLRGVGRDLERAALRALRREMRRRRLAALLGREQGADLPGDVARAVLEDESVQRALGRYETVIRSGLEAALFGGLESVAGNVRRDQGLPEDVLQWWESRSNLWASTLSEDTVVAVRSALVEGLAAGESINQLEARLRDVFVGNENSYELGARRAVIEAVSESRLRQYGALGVAHVVFVATPDDRTTQTCWDLDGRVFLLSEASGIIPVHWSCRCTWVAASELEVS